MRGMFETMVLIKACEERVAKGLRTGEFAFQFWPSRGQEAVAAGVMANLRADDRLVTTYRGVHDLIAKGVPLAEIAGEMLGRETGACRGKGGTMHIGSPEVGAMLSTGIVGAGPPVAVGLALAAKHHKSDRVVVVSFGDGATNTGSFHEAMNLASLWNLPVLFVCQNNGYAEMTPTSKTMKIPQVVDRALAYDMPGRRVDGNDPNAVHQATAEAVERARSGGGPTFLELTTYRFSGHYFGDTMTYMPPEELKAAIAADPVTRYGQRLVDEGLLNEASLAAIEKAALEEVDAAFRAAVDSPLAADDEIQRDVYDTSVEGAR